MAPPHERVAEAIHRTHHNDEMGTCVGYWPEDMTMATAAIEALREDATASALYAAYKRHTGQAPNPSTVIIMEFARDAILGPLKEGE